MRIFTLLLATTLLFGCYARKPEKTGLEGKPLPEFSLLLTDSVTYFNTTTIPPGKPVVLFYFSPHCPYCRAQVQEIIEDMDILKDVQFCMVTGFSVSEMRHFYQEFQLARYNNIIMGTDSTNFLADYFETAGVPYTAVYGKDRKLRKCFLGKVYGRQIKEVAMQ